MKLQFLGHSCVKLGDGSFSLLIDPFITGNAKAPLPWQKVAEGVTHVLLTHGHSDHVGDTVAIARENNIPVLAIVELARWLEKQGVKDTIEANLGGTLNLGHEVSVSLVPAWHTSASDAGEYLGTPAGLVVSMGGKTVYHAGDTAIFAGMGFINDLFAPDVVILPIGGIYTMDARMAAYAAETFFPHATIVPVHYATFPVLAPDAGAFEQECAARNVKAHVMAPGDVLEV